MSFFHIKVLEDWAIPQKAILDRRTAENFQTLNKNF